jgi:hypothetical protein
MSRTILLIACILSLSFVLPSCSEDQVYPVVPAIEFISLTKIQNTSGIDDKGMLKISFTDGDGDIGLSDFDVDPPYDTGSIYYYNCFIKYFEKKNGQFEEIILPFTNNYRIPYTPPAQKGLPLVGDIDIELYINNYTSNYDTIRYEVYIVDRALNHSNTITTPELVIDKH